MEKNDELEKIENTDNIDESENLEEKISKLESDLESQKKLADEYFDSLKRNMAEFDNFKKRMSKEKETMYSLVLSNVLSDLLPILDNFEQALGAKCEDENFKSGIEMIKNQFNETLNKLGLEEIEALGKEFNPDFHEAVMHIEDENYKEKEIVEVLRKGYKHQDKVIRHTMVKVAN